MNGKNHIRESVGDHAFNLTVLIFLILFAIVLTITCINLLVSRKKVYHA